MYVFLRSMSSNEDQSAEEKETEEVEVGERSAVDGVNEAVGGGGDDPAAGGGGGSVRFGVLGSSTYTDTEVREMLQGRRLEVVAKASWAPKEVSAAPAQPRLPPCLPLMIPNMLALYACSYISSSLCF